MPTTAMRPASKRAPAKVATGRADATPVAPAAPTTPASLLRHGHGVQQVANASHHSRADIKTLPSSDSGIVDSRLLSLSLSVCVSIKKDLIQNSKVEPETVSVVLLAPGERGAAADWLSSESQSRGGVPSRPLDWFLVTRGPIRFASR